MTFQILHGHTLNALREMDSESVQCVITSPPYYGLRSYGTEPQVWGNHNGCSHEWSESTAKLLSENRNGKGSKTLEGGSGEYRSALHGHAAGTTGFCLSCNAWRGELGLEPTFQLYISHLIEIFAEVKRVLKRDGTCWVNLGDSYGTQSGNAKDIANGKNVTYGAMEYHAEIAPTNKPNGYHKSLLNIPARFAIAMTDELKMIQRNELIWHKPACMPSSAKDRFTVDFEPIYFFAKEPRYKFNQQLEPTITFDKNLRDRDTTKLNNTPGKSPSRGLVRNDYELKNKRTVWRVNFEPQSAEHYASYPTKLVEPMILAGTDEGDTVLDIFNGTATTGVTAIRNRRGYIGIELQEKYIDISKRRLKDVQVNLF